MSKPIFKEIALKGKLITSDDATQIDANYQIMKNMLHGRQNPRACRGMKKINTVAMSTYLKVRSSFHYFKEKEAESHILAQAWNTDFTGFAIKDNTSAIPAQGAFASTDLYTVASGATLATRLGRFSPAPNNQVVYCDGGKARIWSGNEHAIGQFINYNPDNSFIYDYSAILQNDLDDTANIASLYSVTNTSGTLLLHLDNNVTDSGGTPHTPVNTTVTFSSSDKVIGTHSGVWDGSSYITIPRHANFDLTSGAYTINLRIKIDDTGASDGVKYPIYFHKTDATHYEMFAVQYQSSSGKYRVVKYTKNGAGSATVPFISTYDLSPDTWYDIEVSGNSGNYYGFLDGTLKNTVASSGLFTSYYTGDVVIGYDDVNTIGFKGKIDECYMIRSVLHTGNFTPEIFPYAGTTAYVYLGTTRPIGGDSKGVKFYVYTANDRAGQLSGSYWDGSAYTALTSMVDGTALGGTIPLGQTGIFAFTSTVDLAKPKIENGQYLYWYRFTITNLVSAATKLTRVTVYMPFQTVVNLWDGVLRNLAACFHYASATGVYTDNSTKIFKDDDYIYDATNDATYWQIEGLLSDKSIIVQYDEQLAGLHVQLDGGNTAANTTLTLQYSANGGTTWTTLSIVDGTSKNAISFAITGFITWDAPTLNSEFPLSINGGPNKYTYKLTFNQTIATSTKLYSIKGIAAPVPLLNYNFGFIADNSTWLCKDNYADKSNTNMPDVFNGNDSVRITFGNGAKLVAATSLYSQLSGQIYDIKLFFTSASFFGLTGESVDSYREYTIKNSQFIGCISPLTLHNVDIRGEKGGVSVALWEGMDGFYMFNNTVPMRIDDDIKHFFDPNESASRRLHTDYRSRSYCIKDYIIKGTRWLFCDGNSTGTCNREYVIDWDSLRWSEIDRGSALRLQAGTEVQSIQNNPYAYGFIDTGYMERLEYDTSMDGTAYSATLKLGDMAPIGNSIWALSQMTDHRLVMKGVSGSTQSVAVKHYGDSATTGTSLTSVPCAPATGKTIVNYKEPNGWNSGEFTFHSLEYICPITSDNPTFEPLFVGPEFTVTDKNQE